jgi:predicted ArsR family transcriptional regulator
MDTSVREQETRQAILEYLKQNGSATVDELAEQVKLNSVTVRHHLDVLRREELISDPVVRHRSTPGRPQYAYALTAKASAHFPKNYCDLAAKLLEEIKASTPPAAVNVIFEGVANRLAAAAPKPVEGEALPERLERAVTFLNAHGYDASWEQTGGTYLLHTCNCPYEALATHNPELCAMDIALAQNLLGGSVQRVSRVLDGASTCSYCLASPSEAPASSQEPELSRTQSS